MIMSQSEESKLISELKKKCFQEHADVEYCNSKAEETVMKEFAEIFHKLGVIYLNKNSSKLDFIRSAALFMSAKVRNFNNEVVESDLEKLWNIVLDRARAQDKIICIKKISKELKKKVHHMRLQTKLRVNQLPKLDFNLPSKTLRKAETKKIESIENIQDELTSSYKNIMRDIAKICLNMLGEQPCKFSLVGMGSLARKEVTPYSDFECVILLEEGVHLLSNYEDILEYYKWFAVIFQIILISLGETILPSVAIPGLNGSEKDKNWFYDDITPQGISFDGFMPHACKTPLGRQEFTKNKPWKTELIKPVSEMLKYLSTDEDLKNEYHLANVLTQTCFVYGDETLHKTFSDGACKGQEKYRSENETEFHRRFFKELQNDYKKFNPEQALVNLYDLHEVSIKTAFYRNPIIFLSAYSKCLCYQCSSSFEIISKLQQEKHISKDLEHKLKYVVAIACEVRLKAYQKQQRQADTVSLFSTNDTEDTHIFDLIGIKSFVDFFTITLSLNYYFPFSRSGELRNCIEEDTKHMKITWESEVCFVLRWYYRCLQLLSDYLEHIKAEDFESEKKSETLCKIGLTLFMLDNQEKIKAKSLFVHCVFKQFGENFINLRDRHYYFVESKYETYQKIYTLFCICSEMTEDTWHILVHKMPSDYQLPCSLENFYYDEPTPIDVVENRFSGWIAEEEQNNTLEDSYSKIVFLKRSFFGVFDFYEAVTDLRLALRLRWPQLCDKRKYIINTRKRSAEDKRFLHGRVKKTKK